ncbi:teichoic acid transporter [Oenococcus oeni IOEB_9517]|uniref:oligosaccharide flippase family protein n=1 Tax=Oenococcus oeni TaxID=1247 RepID=UPI00050F3A88|nr:oligosaccharide flippase family protein [Oenococcus oeni]KGH67485.1 teichoic acid transporter [Oenococcus oeni IOEB_9517]KGI03480.1 teichoic acid transporter [Oenococcus oeni IOEB_L65_2]
MRKHIFQNLIYQSFYQVLKIIMPLITVPIVSHALGVQGIGKYSFANSIAQYFVLIAALGLPLYGTREIAKVRDSKDDLSKTFWNLEGFSLILTSMVVVFYFLAGFIFNLGLIYFIQVILVLGTGLDVSWFFMGMEDFKKITLVNFILQILYFVLIVTQIKSSGDLIKYTVFISSLAFLNPLTLWFFVHKKISFVRPKINDMFIASKESFLLFIPQVAIVLYTNMNKTMLGILSSKSYVGVFTNALLVTTTIITLISTIDTVLMPHATRLFVQKKFRQGYRMIQKVLNLEVYFTIAIAAGIFAITSKLVPWFFGATFSLMEYVLPIAGLLVIAIPGGMTISKQYLIPQGRIKEYNNSVYIGAVISILLNFILIPVWGAIGAALVSVIVEAIIWLIRLVDFWKRTHLGYSVRQVLMNLLSAGIMILLVKLVTNGFGANVLTTVIQVLIGGSIYLVLTTILKANPLISILKEIRK